MRVQVAVGTVLMLGAIAHWRRLWEISKIKWSMYIRKFMNLAVLTNFNVMLLIEIVQGCRANITFVGDITF